MARRLREWGARARRVQARLSLSTANLVVLGLGAVVMLGAGAVLGAVSEDVTQHNGLWTSDPSNLRLVVDHRSPWLVDLARDATTAGAAPVLGLVAVVAGIVLWRGGATKTVALAPTAALAIAAPIVAIAKAVVARPRPPVALRLVAEHEASFPSGHTADSAAVFLTLGLVVAVFVARRHLTRVAAVATAGLATGVVGASRLVLGVHFPTDVLASLALGVIVAVAVSMTVFVVDHGELLLRDVKEPGRRGQDGRL